MTSLTDGSESGVTKPLCRRRSRKRSGERPPNRSTAGSPLVCGTHIPLTMARVPRIPPLVSIRSR
jgi:hypothetical protein